MIVLILFVFYTVSDVKAQECPHRTLASKYLIRLTTDGVTLKPYKLQLTRIGAEEYSTSLKDGLGRLFNGIATLSCGEFGITLPVSETFSKGKNGNPFYEDVDFICMGFVQSNKTIKGTCSGIHSIIEGSQLSTFSFTGHFSARPN